MAADLEWKPKVPEVLNFDGWMKGAPLPARADLHALGFLRWSHRPSFGQMGFGERQKTVESFGYAIPCREALAALLCFGPWLEVGAGSGYWSAILASHGADVIATDIAKPGKRIGFGFMVGEHFAVQCMDGAKAVRAYPGRAVLAVWPSVHDEWCEKAADEIPVGGIFALVHEGSGGCIADDGLFDLLEDKFATVAEVALPTWPGIADRLEIFRRVKP